MSLSGRGAAPWHAGSAAGGARAAAAPCQSGVALSSYVHRGGSHLDEAASAPGGRRLSCGRRLALPASNRASKRDYSRSGGDWLCPLITTNEHGGVDMIIITITIIVITIIIRRVATQCAGLARWRDLPQAAGS